MLKEDLITIAEYLYGDTWQTSYIAYDLEIGTRTVRAWLTGTPIKASIAKDICKLVRKKQKAFRDLEKILKKYE